MARAPSDKSTRPLARHDWIQAAITVMVERSVEDVRVERLAVLLKASKGSFYWHFRDRDDLLSALLDDWRNRSTHAVQTRLANSEPDIAQRILRIMQLPFRSHSASRAADLELAIMGWARHSEAARAAVSAVDAARSRYLMDLFAALGVTGEEAQFRTHLAYSALRYVAQRRDMPTEERINYIGMVHALATALPSYS